MSLPSRVAPRLRYLRQAVPASHRSFVVTSPARNDEEWPQRFPIGPFYESILQDPTPYPFDKKPEEPPSSADPEVLPEAKKKKKQPAKAPGERPPKKKPGRKPKSTTTDATAASSLASTDVSTNASPPTPSPPPTTAQEKARIIFGTRLAGPNDRDMHIASKKDQSTYVAGVLVPPEPEEPDNCCMSGCVNCVWDLFREDMEEYTAKKVEAQRRMAQSAGSMDADGGGSETNWAEPPKGVQLGEAKIAKDMWDDDVFKNVPVGIREFMKQEKRLKERHEREGTSGG